MASSTGAERTTLSLTPDQSSALRGLALALGYHHPRQRSIGSISALLQALATATGSAPDLARRHLTEVLRPVAVIAASPPRPGPYAPSGPDLPALEQLRDDPAYEQYRRWLDSLFRIEQAYAATAGAADWNTISLQVQAAEVESWRAWQALARGDDGGE